MPMISFSGETSQGPFWKQIQEGKKTQTVRRPRKKPICEGDTLYLYWKVRVPRDKKPIHLIHTAVCTRVRRLTYIEFAFDDAFARRDGFRDIHELHEWFGDPFLSPGTEYVVIEWELLYSIEKRTQLALETASVVGHSKRLLNTSGVAATPSLPLGQETTQRRGLEVEG